MQDVFVTRTASVDYRLAPVCPTCMPELIRPFEYSNGAFNECTWWINPTADNLRRLKDGRVVINIQALIDDGWRLDENDTWIEPISATTENAA